MEPTFQVPQDAANGQTIHVILQVTDNGAPPLDQFPASDRDGEDTLRVRQIIRQINSRRVVTRWNVEARLQIAEPLQSAMYTLQCSYV